jgi:hypothetical protein
VEVAEPVLRGLLGLLVHKDLRGLKEKPDRKVLQALLVHKDLLVPLALLALQGHKERLDLRVLKVTRELPEQLVLKVLLERTLGLT